MASSLMHLAVTENLLDGIRKPDLLRLGCVLVDAGGQESHFRARAADGRKYYDLNRFREEYGERLRTDDFCLGYYLHLIQDMFYRTFVYGEHQWNPHVPGNVDRLYNDYRLLNTHLVQKYGFQPMTLPDALRNHPLLPDRQRAEAFLEDMKPQYKPYHEGDFFFLTPAMSAEYIDRAAEICQEELYAIREGCFHIEPMQYAYG